MVNPSTIKPVRTPHADLPASHLPTSRAEAIEWGMKAYVGQAPCSRGHEQPVRWAHNKACVACERDARARRAPHMADRERERKAAWRRDNPDRDLAHDRAYRQRNADVLRERKRNYIERDPYGTIAKRLEAKRIASCERRQAKRKALALAHAARAAERARRDAERYALAHAAAMVAHGHPGFTATQLRDRVKRGKHRAKKFGRITSLKAYELAYIGDLQGWRCAMCGSTNRLVLDHILPLSIGGHHVVNNVQWLCHFHNDDKRNMPDGEYRRLRGIPACTRWDVL